MFLENSRFLYIITAVDHATLLWYCLIVWILFPATSDARFRLFCFAVIYCLSRRFLGEGYFVLTHYTTQYSLCKYTRPVGSVLRFLFAEVNWKWVVANFMTVALAPKYALWFIGDWWFLKCWIACRASPVLIFCAGLLLDFLLFVM